MDAASAASQTVSAGWLLFDACVGLEKQLANTDTAAACATRTGGVVGVSLRLASPPAFSTVHLYSTERAYGRRVLAADRDLLLINMVVPVQNHHPGNYYPDNFFVYKADAHAPWLRPLPSPLDWIDPSWPWMPHLPGLLHCIGRHENAAISRSGDEFFVANLSMNYVSPTGLLNTGDREEVADLLLYSSENNTWEAKRLNLPADARKEYANSRWRTDAVFSSGGFACWADYHRGILRYDLSSDGSNLGIVRFPGIGMWHDDDGVPSRLRTVSVVGDDGGILKFVDVDNGRYRSSKSATGCTISAWILRTPELEWEKDATVQLDELWSLPDYKDSPLPRNVPAYPVVDRQDANLLHFILLEEDAETWMVTVNLKERSLISYDLEKNVIKHASFCNSKRICTDVCKYMSNLQGN
jgi:hypothetical protein